MAFVHAGENTVYNFIMSLSLPLLYVSFIFIINLLIKTNADTNVLLMRCARAQIRNFQTRASISVR